MRFTYHIGLHCTDEDRALNCLMSNAQTLAAEASSVPRPGRFRPALREAMLALKGAPAPPDMQERLLDAVLETDRPSHVLFSSDSFLCVPQRAITPEGLYPLAGERATWIRQLFPDAPAHFCFALRNPVGLVPALHARMKSDETFADFVDRIEPESLSWHDMVTRLRAAVPDAQLTIWCNEDAPVLWPEILAQLAGRTNGEAADLSGWDAFYEELMGSGALERMRSYLSSHPPKDPAHRRRVIAAFLDRFAQDGAVVEEYEDPVWHPARVQRLTEQYEADIARIEQMGGVTLLLP